MARTVKGIGARTMKHWIGCASGVAAMLLVGCSPAASGGGARSSAAPQAPGWFLKTPDGCVTGAARYKGDIDEAQSVAGNNANTKAAGAVKTLVMGLFKRARESGEVGGADFAQEKTEITRKELIDMPLSGVVEKEWAVMDGQGYMLKCVDPKFAEGYIQNMRSLSDSQRRQLNNRAKEMFKELDEEIAKNRATNGS